MKNILTEKGKLCWFFFIIVSLVCLTSCSGITPTDYTITATAGAGGSITPSGTFTLAEGANQIFTITPDKCYEIANVLIDGLSAGPLTSYTFTDIQADHTISASFVIPGPRIYNTTTGVTYTTIQAAIDATSTLEGFKITNGNAGSGGGIQISLFSDPTIANNIITGNAASSGGGIFVSFSSPVIRGNKITNNTADYDGGGIYAYGEPLTIENNIISDNIAGDYGGGLYFESCSPTVSGNTISHNEATNKGGGIATYISTTDISGNQITGNTTDFYGGGIFMDSGSVTISDNYIEDNTASYGGGIHVDHSSPTITNNTINDNSAKMIGGGIFVSAGSSLLPDTIRLTGWGTLRENIPTIVMTTLLPMEGTEYTIAGNTFLGNKQGTLLDYTEGAHVYFF